MQNVAVPIFACRRCGHYLTTAVTEVPLPAPVTATATGLDASMPARLPRGNYADSEQQAGFVLNPDDVTGASAHPDPGRRNGCCGLDGLDGPNMVCASCGAEIATQQSDCWTQQQITILRDAARPARPIPHGNV